MPAIVESLDSLVSLESIPDNAIAKSTEVQPMEKTYLTPNQVASLLMVAPATLRVWCDKGLIKAQTTAGGHRRFPREEVERFRRERSLGERGRQILIVDDEPALTRYLSAFLKDVAGVSTAIACDGFSAGRLVQTFHPDTLLLDLMMPGLDGFEVCRQIKADPVTRHIRIVAMTGYPTPENIQRILEAGATACLGKPLDEERLLRSLDLAMGEGSP